MTMINPSARRKLSRGNYGGGCFVRSRDQGYEYCCSSEANSCLGSDLMAEEDSRTTEAGSSSKDAADDGGWLQLGIGSGHVTPTTAAAVATHADDNNKLNIQVAGRPGLVELDLLPPGGGGGSNSTCSSSQQVMRSLPVHRQPVFHVQRPSGGYGGASSLFFQQHPGTSSVLPEMNWVVRPLPRNLGIAASTSSSSPTPPGSYFAPALQLQPGLDLTGPSLDLRIIGPPQRPHSGIWFVLQASQNQVKEPFLPQIPKSYLRIKDGRMTVRLLMKYLVNKLRLDSESEIEITCRGQQLLPFMTLQHVRDNIWTTPRDAVVLLPDSSTKDHVMVLHYARRA